MNTHAHTQPGTRPVFSHPLQALRYHVTGAIERGEGVAIVEKRANPPGLLSASHPLCLRRLVRELNALPDGFYVNAEAVSLAPREPANVRCNRAKLTRGRDLRVRAIGERAFWRVSIPMFGEWKAVFSDAYGREVTASRRA